jgi:glycosyltransferase involved in cell wall biosynthesis
LRGGFLEELMRVLHVYSGNLYGGVETLLVTLARYQALYPELEHHFALCFEGRLSKELAATGASIHLLGNVRVSRPLTVWRGRRACRDLLARDKFDLVVCHSAWSQAIFGPVARSVRLPLVFWLHDATDGRHWLERWARRTQPDLVLCNSRFTAKSLANIYPHVKGETVCYPVSPPTAYYSNVDRAAVRAEFNTPEDATVIIQVSRMEAWKVHLLHLNALGELVDLPDWICWIVGGAQRPQEVGYLNKLKTTATRLEIAGRIRFLGQRSDIPRLLAAADIHCQPNTGPEPFGITFVEGLFARLPVVTTAIGGAQEIVDDSCGFLVQPNNSHSLAGCLRRLIQDRALRTNLGTAGPIRARRLCDPAIQMKRLNNLLNRVAEQDISGDSSCLCKSA